MAGFHKNLGGNKKTTIDLFVVSASKSEKLQIFKTKYVKKSWEWKFSFEKLAIGEQNGVGWTGWLNQNCNSNVFSARI